MEDLRPEDWQNRPKHQLAIINDWKHRKLSGTINDPNQQLLLVFIKELGGLMRYMVIYHNSIKKHKGEHTIFNNTERVLERLKIINNITTIIQNKARGGNTVNAYKLKFSCVTLFDECTDTLNLEFCINVFKSLLQEDFKTTRYRLENSINSDEVKILSTPEINKPKGSEPEYYKQTWFKVGILFAQGKPQKLYKQNINFTKTATELGFKKTDKVYFSETINNNLKSKSNKNIYADLDKMLKIEKYCNDNKIDITNSFTDQIKLLQKRY